MSTESRITEAMEALQTEGVEMASLGEIEARLMNLLFKARRIRNAASMLPLLGAEVTAERLGCCRQTVYNLAKTARKKSNSAEAA
jgi:predicted DNA-binding protein (UPF0251 family)